MTRCSANIKKPRLYRGSFCRVQFGLVTNFDLLQVTVTVVICTPYFFVKAVVVVVVVITVMTLVTMTEDYTKVS